MAVTARARLAAVYVALVAAAGVVLIALTYLLLRGRINVRIADGGDAPSNSVPLPDLAARMRGETLRQLLVQSLIALAVVVAVAGVVGWLVAGRLLRPIRAISRSARRVSAANLRERVPATGPPDELTALAGTVNGMLDRLQEGIAERDRLLEGQRLFVANAAHELRTPLATMRTAIDVTLDGDPTRAELHAMITDVSSAVDASRHTLDGLLTLAQSQPGSIHRDHVDLAHTVAIAVEQAAAEADRRQVRLTEHLRPAPIRGDAVLLLRLAGNLIDNAVRYNHKYGTVHVDTRADERTACLRVTNTGPVLRSDDLAALFRPFVRGTGARLRAGGGTGLGLSIVDAIATAHDGEIDASAPPSGGLDLSVRFPATVRRSRTPRARSR